MHDARLTLYKLPGTRPAGMTAADARKAAWNAVKAAPAPSQRTQDQKAADVGEQPAMSPEEVASNTRLAEALVKTTDFSGIKPQLTDALQNGGLKAQVEFDNLYQLMEARKPGHGEKLAAELGEQPLSGSGVPQSKPKNMLKAPSLPPRKPSLSFNDAIALREVKDLPNGGYDAVAGNPNIAGEYALGRYQMRASALKATHYLDKNGNWADKDGINSYRDFLDTPNVQEKAFKEYQGELGKELSSYGSMKHLGQEIDGIKAKITITRSGLVAAAHRQGSKKVRNYLAYMSANGWKSDFNGLDEKTKEKYLSVETRLREFQNKPLP